MPIPTTRSNILDSSTFLSWYEVSAPGRLEFSRTHRVDSSCIRSSNVDVIISRRVVSSATFVPSSSNLSSTPSRRLVWFRDDRHASPIMTAAATEKRNPSARAFAPFSTALQIKMSDHGSHKFEVHVPCFRQRPNVLRRFAHDARP